MKERENNSEIVKVPKTSEQIGIDNHKKTAKHLQNAAEKHLEAAQYHQDGNHQQAALSTVSAHGYVNLAKKTQKKDAKQHALNG